MQVARFVARAIGWVFVAVIGFHAARAAGQAVRAAADGDWSRAALLGAIAVVAAAVVAAAIVAAIRRPAAFDVPARGRRTTRERRRRRDAS